jgi:hypothetical protein
MTWSSAARSLKLVNVTCLEGSQTFYDATDGQPAAAAHRNRRSGSRIGRGC